MLDGKYKYGLAILRQRLLEIGLSDPKVFKKIVDHRLFKELSKLIAYNGNSFKFHGYIQKIQEELTKYISDIASEKEDSGLKKDEEVADSKDSEELTTNVEYKADGNNIVDNNGNVIFTGENEEEVEQEVENLNKEHLEEEIKLEGENVKTNLNTDGINTVSNLIVDNQQPVVVSSDFFNQLKLTDTTATINKDIKNPVQIQSFLYKKSDNNFVSLLENICK